MVVTAKIFTICKEKSLREIESKNSILWNKLNSRVTKISLGVMLELRKIKGKGK